MKAGWTTQGWYNMSTNLLNRLHAPSMHPEAEAYHALTHVAPTKYLYTAASEVTPLGVTPCRDTTDMRHSLDLDIHGIHSLDQT